MKPTPIHRWKLPGVPQGFELFVKREDMTGSTCSGNKIRKLEFCLGEAVTRKCDSVVTVGGVGSNSARATAIAARQLGMDSHLFLFTSTESVDAESVPCTGNHLLHRISGANIYFLPASTLHRGIGGLKKIAQQFSEKLKSEGHSPYVVEPGVFSPIGTWGYIDAWKEMMQQGVLNRFDDIVLAAGTTGCTCGLAIANYLTGSRLKIHAMSIANSREYCYELIQEHLEEFEITAEARNLVNVIADYIGEGYGKCTDDDLRFILKVMSETGLSLDPTFTVKAVKGMLTEMRERPHIFKGHRVLFIHTGGVFGLFDARLEDVVATSTAGNLKDASEY